MSPMKYTKLLGLKYMVEMDGLTETIRYLNSRGRHGRKYIAELNEVLASLHSFEPPNLFEAFQQSIQAQLYPQSRVTVAELSAASEMITMVPQWMEFSDAGGKCGNWVN